MPIIVEEDDEMPELLVQYLDDVLIEMDEAESIAEMDKIRNNVTRVKFGKTLTIGLEMFGLEIFFTVMATSDNGLTYVYETVYVDFPFLDSCYSYQLGEREASIFNKIFKERILQENIDLNTSDFFKFY